MRRRLGAATRRHGTAGIERRHLDLGSSEIHSDAQARLSSGSRLDRAAARRAEPKGMLIQIERSCIEPAVSWRAIA
jgi:hypothetical protein